MFNILSRTPLVQTQQNFLSKNICRDILNNSQAAILDLYQKLGLLLDVDQSRFESLKIIESTDDKFQVDYFFGELANEQCRQGGNRVSTVLISLSNSSDIYFPWLNTTEKLLQGKLIHFDYHSSDINIKIKTQYKILPGAMIAAVRIREYAISKEVKLTEVPLDFYQQKFQDSVYRLSCGPDDDIRTMEVILPANSIPGNTILVGFTAGMDSSLLLYMLAQLNKLQKIPYQIQPYIIDNRNGSSSSSGSKYSEPIIEDWKRLIPMLDLIRKKTGQPILDTLMHIASNIVARDDQKKQASWDLYIGQFKQKFKKYSYIYVGTNTNPSVPGFPEGPKRIPTVSKPWMNPFINLEKSHIVDALIQLNLEDIVAASPKCRILHADLDEFCEVWQCMERRWAFKRINKIDTGIKHFLKGTSMNNEHFQIIDPLLLEFSGLELPTIGTFILKTDPLTSYQMGGSDTSGGDVGSDNDTGDTGDGGADGSM